MGGFLGIGHFPGESTKKREQAALREAATKADARINQYYDPALATLANEVATPTASPYRQAAFNQAMTGIDRDTERAAQMYAQRMRQSGMGQSSVATQGQGNILRAGLGMKAQARTNLMGADEEARERRRALLFSILNPNASAGIHQNLYQMGQADSQSFLGGLMGLGSLAGTLGWNPLARTVAAAPQTMGPNFIPQG